MKRILSIALALVMVLSIVPATVLAAEATPALPTAAVSEISNEELTFAMNFRVNSVTEEQLAYYGGWYADFELTVNKEVSFNNDGSADGWLAGQYDGWSENWVTVPFGNYAPVTLEAGETVKIMAFAADMMGEPGLKYTYREVYEGVQDFDCGVYFDDEFLLANPDLVVTLELKMYNPENESESYVIGETYTYTNPIVAKNTATNKTYATIAEAMMDCAEGQTVVLLKDTTETIVSIFDSMTLDLNGHALVASYVSGFGDIIDSSADNAGVLTVPANRIMIREDNTQVPIREGNGYRFAEIYKFEAAYREDLGKFGLRPYVEADMLELLKQGSEATGVTIQVKITWKQDAGYRTQNFVYSDEQLRIFLNSYNAATQSYGKLFTLTVKGAENYDELSFTAMVVSETKVAFTPDNVQEQKPAGNVTTNAQNQVVNDVTIGSGNASALVPSGTQLESGANNVTLSATEMEKTTSNITLSDDETMVSMNVHVEGVAANNTTPIIVTLTNVAIEGLNQGNLTLYHVENGETVEMTRVYSLAEVDAHNEYYYDIATGTITMALATFSEIAVRSVKKAVWEGGMDTSWYNPNEDTYVIRNADQLVGLSAIVGGMAEGIQQDSFEGKTVTLLADINLNDTEEDGKIFYPIGYNCSDGSYEKTGDKAVTTGFYSFCGTFDGNGHTIANFYQNTWEMKGDHNWYAPEDQHYRDGMGLFGRVYGGTIKNLTIDNFSSDGEIATTGSVAAYADYGATFENISITNCNPRVYNIGNGGIVGCVGWYTKGNTSKKVTFTNITVDNTNKISALWGSWDVACGGIVGQYYPVSGQSSANYPVNPGIQLTNCHVAAQIDVYNDVCANYQYYAYRYAGMLIGSVRENVTIDGREYPDMTGIVAKNCTVHFGDWNDYYYCELVANSQASYTHDYQMSRLTQVTSVDVENMKYVDLKGVEYAIPNEGRVNYVVVLGKNDDGSWKHGDGHEYAECYHFVNGVQHKHEDSGYEDTIDEDGDGHVDLKEDKQLIYREFMNLVTGYGWGVTSKGLEDFDGAHVIDSENESSVQKFVPVVGATTSFKDGQTVSVGKLFDAIDLGELSTLLAIKGNKVKVFVSPVEENDDVRGTYVANTGNWKNGTVTFSGTGLAKITITDFFYCTATTVVVNVLNSGAIIDLYEPNLIAQGTFDYTSPVTAYTAKSNTSIPNWYINSAASTHFERVAVTNKYAQDGEYSLHAVHSSEKTASSVYQVESFTANAEGDAPRMVRLSVKMRGTVPVKDTCSIRIAFYNSENTSNDTSLNKSATEYFNGSEDWTTVVVEMPIPDNAVAVRANIVYVNTNATANVYVDNAVLTIGDSDENLLDNPSFETTPTNVPASVEDAVFPDRTDWTQSNVHAGTVSAIMDPDGSENGVLKLHDTHLSEYVYTAYPEVNLQKGKTYAFTVRFKADAEVTDPRFAIYLRHTTHNVMGQVDENGELILDALGNPIPTNTLRSGAFKPTTEWQTKTLVFTIPENATTEEATFCMRLATGSECVGSIYVDDVTLKEICAHTWGEKVWTTAESTCLVAGTYYRTCTKDGCGAVETVTATLDHVWNRDVCTLCGTVCTHTSVGGICTECKMEVPDTIHNELFINGSFDMGSEQVITHHIANNQQFAPWFAINSVQDNLDIYFTNEWASQGDWSVKIVDNSDKTAVSINQFVDIGPADVERTLFLSADFAKVTGTGQITLTVQGYNGEERTGWAEQTHIQEGTGRRTLSETIPAGVDRLLVKVTTHGEDKITAFVDNMVCTVDGSKNLLTNYSFETFTLGAVPEVSDREPEIFYPQGTVNSKGAFEGWRELDGTIVDGEIVEEIVWVERDGKETAVLHLVDKYDATVEGTNATAVYYDLFGLEKGKTYTLKFDLETIGENATISVVQMDENNTCIGNNTITNSMGSALDLGYRLYEHVSSADWTTYTFTFTTESVDFNCIRIKFTTGSEAVTEAWFDNISLTEVYDHAHDFVLAGKIDATCVTAGSRTVICVHCGVTGISVAGEPTGKHTCDGHEPTCTQAVYCTTPGCTLVKEATGHTDENADSLCDKCGQSVEVSEDTPEEPAE